MSCCCSFPWEFLCHICLTVLLPSYPLVNTHVRFPCLVLGVLPVWGISMQGIGGYGPKGNLDVDRLNPTGPRTNHVCGLFHTRTCS